MEEKMKTVDKVSQVKQFLNELDFNLDLAHSELNTLESMFADVLRDEKETEEVTEEVSLVPLANKLSVLNETAIHLVKKIQSMQKRQELL